MPYKEKTYYESYIYLKQLDFNEHLQQRTLLSTVPAFLNLRQRSLNIIKERAYQRDLKRI